MRHLSFFPFFVSFGHPFPFSSHLLNVSFHQKTATSFKKDRDGSYEDVRLRRICLFSDELFILQIHADAPRHHHAVREKEKHATEFADVDRRT